jgi:hypothetical protein
MIKSLLATARLCIGYDADLEVCKMELLVRGENLVERALEKNTHHIGSHPRCVCKQHHPRQLQ